MSHRNPHFHNREIIQIAFSDQSTILIEINKKISKLSFPAENIKLSTEQLFGKRKTLH